MPSLNKSGSPAGTTPVLYAAAFILSLGSMAFCPPPALSASPSRDSLPEASGFPFMIRNLDSASPVSAAFLNDHAAGSRGYVRAGSDGRLYLGSERIRFMGTNFTSLPKKEDAPEMAQRLAALGINIIRFHHMDSTWSNALLKNTTNKTTRVLDAEALDRLDFFASELYKNGIYVNMNLLVGRHFNPHDGLPPEIDQIKEVKARHAIGFWDEAVYQLQEEFARQLLDRVNPYTGRRWADDPAMAMLEINNENSLLQAWYNGYLEQIHESLLEPLRKGWVSWLKNTFKTDSSLREAFTLSSPAGAELLQAPAGGHPGPWNLESHGGSAASLSVTGDGSLRLEVKKAGSEGWHVQLNQARIATVADSRYTLSFKLRSTGRRTPTPLPLQVSVMMAHAPWQGLGFDARIEADSSWREYRFVIPQLSADSNARVNFSNLGLAEGAVVEFKDISFAPGGDLLADQGSLDAGDLRLPANAREARPPKGLLEEWIAYLYSVEDRYWERMHAFLREELGVKALTTGTIVGCTTPDLMERFDIIDTHSYWNHPVFPGTDWDNRNNYVSNTSILRSPSLGGLGSLSFMRIKGKPFSVSEYDHPWPNQYAFEMYPLLAAWAAWQDWDMLYTFTADAEDGGNAEHITGFFDQLRNPVKAAAIPFAARIFRQGLVEPAKSETLIHWDRATALERAGEMKAWSIFGHESLGVDPRLALSGRIALSSAPNALRTAPGKSLPALDTLLQRSLAAPLDSAGGLRFPVDTGHGYLFITNERLFISLRAQSDEALPTSSFPIGLAAPLPDTGALVMIRERPAGGGPQHSLILNSWVAGNSGEALEEYSGRLSGRAARLVHPFSIERIRSSWIRGQRKAWAAVLPLSLVLPRGSRLEALGPDGSLRPAVNQRSLGPQDKTLWYVIREN